VVYVKLEYSADAEPIAVDGTLELENDQVRVVRDGKTVAFWPRSKVESAWELSAADRGTDDAR